MLWVFFARRDGMAICLKCSKRSNQVGELCSCGGGYTVYDDHGNDPLGLLGKMLANKLLPMAVLSTGQMTICYEALEPMVDRTVSLIVGRPEMAKDPEFRTRFLSLIDKFAVIKSPNSLGVLEEIELPETKTLAITCEAYKGEPLIEFMATHEIDPVGIMHIIHQILQVAAAYHKNGIAVPHLSMSNIRIMRMGSDEYFVKLTGMAESVLSWMDKEDFVDDVYHVGQLALSLMTGKPSPIETVELPADRAYLLPIAQIFLRAIAPADKRFSSCIELCQTFEAVFELNTRDSEQVVPVRNSVTKKSSDRHTPVPYDQVIWMHCPPGYRK